MDELLLELDRFNTNTSSAFTLGDVALVLLLSFALSLGMAWVYRYTHRGTSYSQSFAQTLVVMSVATALIMLIIGSNIARAFSLIGALSVIRFRNALKETRDVGFMFVAMAIGMACGTRFYLLAIIADAALTALMVLMFKLDMFDKRVAEQLLRVRLPADWDHETALEPVLRKHLEDSRLVSTETAAGGALQEVVYSVVLRQGAQRTRLLEELRAHNGNNKVVLVMGQQEVDL